VTVSPYGLVVPREMTAFAQRVLDAVDRIPRGQVMSYGDVAEYVAMGSARAVGRVMATFGSEVPWHRVLHNDGTCAAGHESRQLALLRREGVPVRGRRVDMRVARWDGR
jgi:alkylated DNA nucleotide flippase Atl1